MKRSDAFSLGYLRDRLLCLARDRRGGPAMEFAVIAPVLMVVLISVYDLGSALQTYIRLAEAVRAGGSYADAYPVYDSSNTNDALAVNSTAIINAVTSAVPDWTFSSGPSVSMACYCVTTSPTVSSTAQSSCAGATCTSTQDLRRYITISATKAFTPILLSNITSISYTHVIRYQ